MTISKVAFPAFLTVCILSYSTLPVVSALGGFHLDTTSQYSRLFSESLWSIAISIPIFYLLSFLPFQIARLSIRPVLPVLKPSFALVFYILLCSLLIGIAIIISYELSPEALEEARLTLFFKNRYIKIVPLALLLYLLLAMRHILIRFSNSQILVICLLYLALCSVFYYRQIFGIFILVLLVYSVYIERVKLQQASLAVIPLGLLFIGWNLSRSGSQYSGFIAEIIEVFSAYIDNTLPLSMVDACLEDYIGSKSLGVSYSAYANFLNMTNFFSEVKFTTSQMLLNSCISGIPVDIYKSSGGGITYGIVPDVVLAVGTRNPFLIGVFVAFYVRVVSAIIDYYSLSSSTVVFSILQFLLLLTSIFDLPVAIARSLLIFLLIQFAAVLTKLCRTA